jgi:putative iron-regulated protein
MKLASNSLARLTRITRRTSGPVLATLLFAFAGFGCSGEDDDTGVPRADVVKNYAALVAANYADALAGAKDLDAAVRAFTDSPSEQTLDAAKSAWLASRTPYGLSEAYRFYQGPIDNDDSDDDIPDGPEGLINSWPLDESYIDYVVDAEGAPISGGIINSPEEFPSLDAETLAAENAKVTETTISTGYHAIEFLLWGQDLNEGGPGTRPYTDFVTDAGGTAENQARRSAYLVSVSSLLVDDLSLVNEAWLDAEANYRADFVSGSSAAALEKMLLGMGSLAGAELSGERMRVAYDNKDQEDEHSCFSDNTLADLHNNATSIQDVLLGRYGDLDGPGIDELVEAKDAALANELREQIQKAIDNIDAVPDPFDQAILGDDDSEARQHLLAAIQALQHFTETLVDAAHALNIDLKFDE